MTKREWRKRAKAAEAELTRMLLPPPLTFDNLTICFPDRTVTHRGKVIHVDTNCIAFPLTNHQNLLAPAGWYAISEARDD